VHFSSRRLIVVVWRVHDAFEIDFPLVIHVEAPGLAGFQVDITFYLVESLVAYLWCSTTSATEQGLAGRSRGRAIVTGKIYHNGDPREVSSLCTLPGKPFVSRLHYQRSSLQNCCVDRDRGGLRRIWHL
jgi:hypothetical protein